MAQRQRKIIHIDMDAFYAAVEQRDFPQYRGQPLIVGGPADGRGVVATCSYEARKFGIHSAMPCAHARRLCPQAIFVRPRFDVYRAVSRVIRDIFGRYTPLVEPLSLDEAYLDVTDSDRCHGSATLIARDIKRTIFAETGLVASAGVSYNKFLAKIASDMDKPDGLYLIEPEHGPAFVASLPVGRFHGVGRATETRMQELGIHTGADLRRWSLAALERVFGKAGQHYYHIARGVDERPVVVQRERKSLGTETTFAQDLRAFDEVVARLHELAREVLDDLNRRELKAHTLTIKVKYSDFTQVTRSVTRPWPLDDEHQVAQQVSALAQRTEAGQRPVRLLGVTVSGLAPAGFHAPRQLTLF